MNRFQKIVGGVGALLFLTLADGCQLETIVPPPPSVNSASNLVINEVFTLSPTNPAPFSWIELYNPTGDTINLVGWTLNYYTARLNRDWTVVIDTGGLLVGFPSETVTIDSVGYFDVPFAEAVLDIPGIDESTIDFEGINADTVRLPPGGLYTLVNNEDRMLDHIQWGPGDERFTYERALIQGIFEFAAVIDSSDTTTTTFTATQAFGFILLPTAQISLKDPAGNVVDVVRYGNYVYSGPSTTDPYPGNVTLGPLPPFQSIQRYASAYFTANSANDFYVSSSQIVPTPQWYSQVHKR